MEKKEIQELIDAAITKAAEATAASVETLNKAMATATENMTALVTSVEEIAKQSPGTKQDQEETAEIQKEQVDLGKRIADIANGTVEKK